MVTPLLCGVKSHDGKHSELQTTSKLSGHIKVGTTDKFKSVAVLKVPQSRDELFKRLSTILHSAAQSLSLTWTHSSLSGDTF